jgi:predicted PurR-regulated permease PerM
MNATNGLNNDKILRYLFYSVIVIAIFILIYYLRNVLLPFVVASLLAYFIHPLVNWMQIKFRLKNKTLAIVFALISVFCALGLVLWGITNYIKDEFAILKMTLIEMIQKNQIRERINEYIPETWRDEINSIFQSDYVTKLLHDPDLLNYLTTIFEKLSPKLAEIFTSIGAFFSLFTLLILVMLYMIFILNDYNALLGNWRNFFPKNKESLIVRIIEDFKDATRTYFKAQALIATIVGLLFSIAFYIMGLPMAIFMGILIGICNLVPYVQLATIPPVIFLVFIQSAKQGQSFWILLVAVLAIYAFIQIIQDLILTPKIMGNATGLNPAIMILSLSIWGKLLGFLGLIIALPLSFLLISYYNRFVLKKS